MDIQQAPRALGACQLQYTGVMVACALALTFFCSVFFLWWLRGVLVPLTFAVFLAFLCEPVLRMLVRAPRAGLRLLRRAGRGTSASDADMAVRLAPGARKHLCCRLLLVWLQRLWDVAAVMACAVALVGILLGGVYVIIAIIKSFDWSVYDKSPKLQEISELLRKAGIIKQDQSLDPAAIWGTFKGELLSAAFSFFDFFSSVLLTSLMYLFCLIAMLPGIHDRSCRSRVQDMVQQFLIRKTIASFLIALLVIVALLMMHVPLPLVFGVLTFLLNYIPNIGSLIAILLPVPLVWLEPGCTFLHAFLVVVVQFLVHNIAGNLIEPWIMSQGLDLHPLTIVIALTFWGSIWGIPGAVLSVPMTCTFRLWLRELEHPYAEKLNALFNNPMGLQNHSARQNQERGNSALL